MTTTQDTLTWVTTTTLSLPRTITADTDPQTMEYCQHAYYHVAHNSMQYNGDLFAYATLVTVVEALADGGALTCLYAHDGEVAARTLFPVAVSLTNDNHLTCRAFCTLRREWRTFRLDRMQGAHLVVMTGEVAA